MQVLAIGLALWCLPMAALWLMQGWQATLTQMGWFFTKAALLTFGGAYAVLPYVHQGAVEHYQWLSTPQMIDGLALGETTPGPLIMVVAFVGFLGGWQQALFGPEQQLAAGIAAAVVVTWFTFLPSFIFILAGGPLVEATRGQLALTAPLKAISAAVVGVIANLALFFAWHVFWPEGWKGPVDGVSVLMAVVVGLALIRFKMGVLPVLLAAAALGLVLSQGWVPGVAGVPGLAGR
jgi:chromate transporter